MKRFLPILLLVFSVGVGAETMDDLVKRDGIYYKKFTDVPFTGKITGTKLGTIRNGKKHGLWVFYHDNGQLRSKGNYKDGKKEGEWVGYSNDGDLKYEGTYKDDAMHGQGTRVRYFRDKVFKYVGEFKDGMRHGQGTYTNHNGDTYVGEFKDSKRWTGTYYGKDGKAIATWSDGVEKPVN